MEEIRKSYVPAAGRDWALPFYDPLVKLLGGDRARETLVNQASIRPGQRVLDIGCGTGTLVTLIKRRHPEVEAVGLDPDPKALDFGGPKSRSDGLLARLLHSSHRLKDNFGDRMPYFLVEGASVYDRLRRPKFHLLAFSGGRGRLRDLQAELGTQYAGPVDFDTIPLDRQAEEVFGARRPFSVLLRSDNYVGLISAYGSAGRVRGYQRRRIRLAAHTRPRPGSVEPSRPHLQ